jgi:hypothetical protein
MARILRGIKEFGQAACELRVRDALASGQAIGVALLSDYALVGDATVDADAVGAANGRDFVPAALNVVVEISSPHGTASHPLSSPPTWHFQSGLVYLAATKSSPR